MGSRESYAEGGINVQLDQGVSHGVIAHRPPFDSKVSVFQAGETPASCATHGKKRDHRYQEKFLPPAQNFVLREPSPRQLSGY